MDTSKSSNIEVKVETDVPPKEEIEDNSQDKF